MSRKPKEANCAMESKSLNQGLSAAKAAKQDEFYTQYIDIQKEVEAYLEFDPDTFRGKVVYCNCDDPFESNFFKYFAANFNKLGLKKLIATSYDGSPIAGQLALFAEYNAGNGKRRKPKAVAVILDQVQDEDGDGAANITDVALFLQRNQAARHALQGSDQHPDADDPGWPASAETGLLEVCGEGGLEGRGADLFLRLDLERARESSRRATHAHAGAGEL